MSELIDSIFDVAAISSEKKQVEKIVASFAEDIMAIKDVINKNLIDIRVSKTNDELSKSAKALNDNIVTGTETTKKYKSELDKLKQKTEQLTGAEKAANIEIAKARLALQAAQKEIKATAAAEIVAQSTTLKVTDSYNALQDTLKESILEYKNYTKSEREAARGQELLKKISDTQQSLKDMDASMKIYNRNVGNYEESVKSAIKSLIDEAKAHQDSIEVFKAASKAEGISTDEKNKAIKALKEHEVALTKVDSELKKYGQSVKSASSSSVDMSVGMDQMTKGAASTAKGFVGMAKSALAFIATPIGAVITAIAVVVGALVKAFSRSEEAMGKLKQVTGALSGVFGGLMNLLTPLVSFIADKVVAAFEQLGNVAEKAMGAVSKGLKFLGFDKAAQNVDKLSTSMKENAKAGQELAKMEADQLTKERELNRIRFEYLKEQEKFRQVRDDVTKSTAERIAANDALGASLKKQSDVEMAILKQALVIAQKRVEIDGATTENLDKVAEAKANIADMEERINGFQSEQLVNAVGIRKEAEDLAKAQNQLIIDAQRRLSDAKINAMQEGEAKAIAMSNENFKRQIEDLKLNGQLTVELQKNLEISHATEIQKIKTDYAKQNKEKAEADAEKAIADFEKSMNKEVAALTAAQKEKETALKKEYSKGKLSKKEYEEALAALQADAAKEANDKTIEILQKELNTFELSADKREEISNRLRDLQVQNENAALDASIAAAESKVEADKAATEKRKQIASDLVGAGMELFGAIGDYQAQQSEQRLAELEAEQTKSDEYFASRQTNLDNSILSDARREEAQKKLNEEQAKRNAAIAAKERAEKVRAAKWEKSQAIVSAVISTAQAIGQTIANLGFPLAIPFVALAAASGAIQIATIASQQIPAFEHGGITKDGAALWGEKRPEVAVTPTGQVLYAEKPTISHFDAGTRIYKSVEDYERNMVMSGHTGFEFDYEKMANAMPSTQINLDGQGLWGIVNKQNDRAIMINRRYKIGR